MEKNYNIIQEYMSEYLANEGSLYEKSSSSEEEQMVSSMDEEKLNRECTITLTARTAATSEMLSAFRIMRLGYGILKYQCQKIQT